MEGIVQLYRSIIEPLGETDPRVRDYFLIWGTPVPVLACILGYFIFIFSAKRYMKHRQAFNISNSFRIAYNMALVFLSLYMFEEIIVGVYQSEYNLLCANVNISTSPAEMKVTNALWWYFFSKVIEFFDTILMVLRKKNDQISFLHLYHHSSMLLIWWFVYSWTPGGQVWFGASLNSFVHIWMYLYYALSLMPSLNGKLWWKKYITIMQLIQFVLVFIQSIIGLVMNKYGSCQFPKWGLYLQLIYMITMMILFGNFFTKSYMPKKPKQSTKKIE